MKLLSRQELLMSLEKIRNRLESTASRETLKQAEDLIRLHGAPLTNYHQNCRTCTCVERDSQPPETGHPMLCGCDDCR